MAQLVLELHFGFLHLFDGRNLVLVFLLAEPHFAERAPADNCDGLEVLWLELLPFLPQLLCLAVLDLTLEDVLFRGAEVQLLHLLLEQVPVLLLLALLLDVLGVLALDLGLGSLDLLASRYRDLGLALRSRS